MATLRRDRRLPGQSTRYRDHPSNVGSPSYYADTGRGWVPNPGVSRNRQALNKRRPSDRQPGIGAANRRVGPSFGYDRAGGERPGRGRPARNLPSRFGGAGVTATAPGKEEEESFSFTDEGLGKNVMQDAGRMLTDLTPNVRMPGIMGIFGDLGTSVGKNREHHEYINSRLGRASPEKNLAFFDQQGFLDAAQTGNSGLLSKQGNQAYGRFSRAGITDNVLLKFMDPGYKFYGNEAWLRSQAHDKELFDDGMTFIKNARDTANLARDMASQEQSQLNQGSSEGDAIASQMNVAPGDIVGGGFDYSDPDEEFEDITEDITADVAGSVGGFGNQEMMEMANNPWYGIYPFEKQRQQATFRDAIQRRGDQRDAPRISDPGMVDYPFGENIMDTYRPPEPKAYEGSTLGSLGEWFGLGYDQDEEELLQNPGITNPRSAILGG